jgi:hypothetical protein
MICEEKLVISAFVMRDLYSRSYYFGMYDMVVNLVCTSMW